MHFFSLDNPTTPFFTMILGWVENHEKKNHVIPNHKQFSLIHVTRSIDYYFFTSRLGAPRAPLKKGPPNRGVDLQISFKLKFQHFGPRPTPPPPHPGAFWGLISGAECTPNLRCINALSYAAWSSRGRQQKMTDERIHCTVWIPTIPFSQNQTLYV